MALMYMWATLATGIIVGLCISAMLRANSNGAIELVSEVDPMNGNIANVGEVLKQAGEMMTGGCYEYNSGELTIQQIANGVYTIRGELVIGAIDLTPKLSEDTKQTIERNFIGRRSNPVN